MKGRRLKENKERTLTTEKYLEPEKYSGLGEHIETHKHST